MPLSDKQKTLLWNVGRYERRFLGNVIKEEIRRIKQMKYLLIAIPPNWKYENAESWFLNEIKRAERKISDIEEKLEGDFNWEEN